jgi:hypothetical protein
MDGQLYGTAFIPPTMRRLFMVYVLPHSLFNEYEHFYCELRNIFFPNLIFSSDVFKENFSEFNQGKKIGQLF